MGLLLSRYSNEKDVMFGATVSGRPTELNGIETMVGMFLNTLPVRVRVNEDESVGEWLKRLQQEQVEQRQYEYSPLVEVAKWSDIERGKEMFDSLLVYENYPVSKTSLDESLNLRVSSACIIERTSYGLTVIAEVNLDLEIRIGYDSRYDGVTVSKMLTHMQELLSGIAADGNKRVGEMKMLSEWERHQIEVEWNDTAADHPAYNSVKDMFEQEARRRPDAVAVEMRGEQVSYGELNRRANRLGRYLRSKGVGVESKVGICVDRSIEMVVAVMGVLKAGGAYVPMDPGYPQERLIYMLKDSQIGILLTQREIVETIGAESIEIILLDADSPLIIRCSDENFESEVTPDNLAFILYTSGSTGRPKGVMNTHRGIFNRQIWMQETYPLIETDKVLQLASFSFDFSVWEILAPLSYGACVILPRPEGQRDSGYLIDLIIDRGVTIVHFIPSMLEAFLDEEDVKKCKSLRRVFSGGEALSFNLQRRITSLLKAGFHNQYGPTEASIDVTYWDCEHDEKEEVVSIGRPNANNRVYVLDSRFRPAAIGISGELYIGGVAVVRGYLNQPGMTAERFLPDPYSAEAGARMYRTGDLAKYLSDGRLQYLGRADNQVKLRGYRIEMGEIEAVIEQHERVKKSVVMAREEEGAGKRLVCYYTSEGEVSREELREHLGRKLPEYMVPGMFIEMEQMPLTANGKVDLRALPSAEQISNEVEDPYEQPCNAIEEIIAGIWSEVLRVSKVGVNDNFFKLGGHSILATQIISRVRKALRKDIELRSLFETPTVRGIARRIQELMQGSTDHQPPQIEPATRNSILPLSFAQQRLWLLHQIEPDIFAFNIPQAIRLKGDLNVVVLGQALSEIVRRHEVLRTTFAVEQGQPAQVIHPHKPVCLPVIDISKWSEAKGQGELERLMIEDQLKPFDLVQGPLLRLHLVKLSDDDHVLLITMHHIVSDGWSVAIFNRELSTIYPALLDGHSPQLPELRTQYADYAVWQRNWLQGEVLERQLSYWKKQLAETPPAAQLPTDCSRPTAQTYCGARKSLTLSKELSGMLKALSRREGVTLFMLLLAAFDVVIHYLTGQDDIVIGTNVANRNRIEVEGLIGFFVNQLPLRTQMSGNPGFRELMSRTRDVALGAYDHQDLPIEKLIDELRVKRDMSRTPLFQILIMTQNVPRSALTLPGLTLSYVQSYLETAKFDLLLEITDTGEELISSIEYMQDLFYPTTIARVLEQFERVLGAVIEEPNIKLDALTGLLAEADRNREFRQAMQIKDDFRDKLRAAKR